MPRPPRPWCPPAVPCLGHVRSSGGAWVSVHAVSLPTLLPEGLIPASPPRVDAALSWDDDAWTLLAPLPTGPAQLRLDPADARLRSRQRDAARKASALVQAFGRLHQGVLWDLTAGLGRDALALSARGFEVTAVERDPVVGLLLADLRRRLPATALQVHLGDARSFLDTNPTPPDAILLDPMFDGHRTRGDVKKDLALLRLLASADGEADADLLQAVFGWLHARAHPARVVVKRARSAPALAAEPTRVIDEGGSTRFDVYDVRV